MNALQNFAAQQLTKKQMNEVKGGAEFHCELIVDGLPAIKGIGTGVSAEVAAAKIAVMYSDLFDNVKATCFEN